MAHTLIIVEPIWPMLSNMSEQTWCVFVTEKICSVMVSIPRLLHVLIDNTSKLFISITFIFFIGQNWISIHVLWPYSILLDTMITL